MEDLNPLLHLVIQIRLGLERGESLRGLLKNYLSHTQTEMTPALKDWVTCLEQGRTPPPELKAWSTAHRKALLHALGRGARGESILPSLVALEQDVVAACEEELDRRAAILPFLCLVPLLLCQFPALMLLILGPLLHQLLQSLS